MIRLLTPAKIVRNGIINHDQTNKCSSRYSNPAFDLTNNLSPAKFGLLHTNSRLIQTTRELRE